MRTFLLLLSILVACTSSAPRPTPRPAECGEELRKIALRFTNPEELAGRLRPHLVCQPQIRVMADSRACALLVAADADDLARVENLVRRLDADAGVAGEPMTRVFALRHAPAEEIAGIITDLLDASRRAAQRRSGSCVLWHPIAWIGHALHRQQSDREMRIVADPRTNTLSVSLPLAQAGELEGLAELVRRLDVTIVTEDDAGGRR